jgi:predicted GTPase
LHEAEREADIIVWDGGNNDTPFYHPDVSIVLFDPHRAGHELRYYPGETNMIMADIAVINKVDSAPVAKVKQVRENIKNHAPEAVIVLAESAVVVGNPERVKGKRILVVEDGPTLTHGEMSFGAGIIAARQHHAAEIVDPRPYAVGSIGETYRAYPHIGPVLPAMGYSKQQVRELERTINSVPCDLVLFATPIQLTRILSIKRPAIRVGYQYRDHGIPTLKQTLLHLLETRKR